MTRFYISDFKEKKQCTNTGIRFSCPSACSSPPLPPMIGGVLMKPEAGKTVKQDFAASAAVRDPAFPVSAALSSTLPETLRPSDSLKALPLPAPPESFAVARSPGVFAVARSPGVSALTLRAVKDFRQRSRRTRIGRLEEGTWCSQP